MPIGYLDTLMVRPHQLCGLQHTCHSFLSVAIAGAYYRHQYIRETQGELGGWIEFPNFNSSSSVATVREICATDIECGTLVLN